MATPEIIPFENILIPSDAVIAELAGTPAPVSDIPAAPAPAFVPEIAAPFDAAPAPKDLTVTDASSLTAATVFLKTRFGIIGNSRKVSGAEVLDTDADKALLRVSKQLLDSPELEAIKQADTKMRTWLYNACLPYDLGVQLLPKKSIESARAKMAEFRAERAELVENFVAAYPGLLEKAAAQLGSLFNAADYPTIEQVRAKFFFGWNIVTFEVPDSLKEISEQVFQEEKAKQEANFKAAADEITALMRQTMFDLVSHLETRLTPGDDGKQKILKESAVANLQKFLESFDIKNVTNDAELAAVVSKARELVDGTSAATLRSSDAFREKIRAGMASVKDQLSGMVEEKAGRKFRDE